jgi:DNA-binding MarR family transcriptional regulator
LVDALLVASRALVGVAARSFADLPDVTIPQYRALVLLTRQSTTTASQLADGLGIHASTATRLCDRLDRKGWIRRQTGSQDRRETVVSLTPAGRRLVERVMANRRRELARIVSRMDATDAATAIRGLTAFTAAADEPLEIDLFGWAPRDRQAG